MGVTVNDLQLVATKGIHSLILNQNVIFRIPAINIHTGHLNIRFVCTLNRIVQIKQPQFINHPT